MPKPIFYHPTKDEQHNHIAEQMPDAAMQELVGD
jgi:hypothetical protein